MVKRQREPLSRERILATALALVDREGLDALSMRRVGDELGVEAMSLYNHVANKAAMLDGIFEAVLAELPEPKRSSSWKTALQDRGRALRKVLANHPNALPLFATRPAVTPASIAHVESALEVLRSAGFEVKEALGAFQVLVAFVVGHTLATCSQQGAMGGVNESFPAYEKLDENFPRVKELAKVLPRYNVDTEFELGLESMLLGLEVRRSH